MARDGKLLEKLRGGPDRIATWVGSAADFALPLTRAELAAAERITTVVLPLGPYRNLTTMTAALFALHPGAVVLNHAADRVFGSRADPFDDLGPARWRRFKAVALRLLRHGRQKSFGGSVLRSHAFRDAPLGAHYSARFGDALRKPGATTLFWKDSMRFQRRLEAGRPALDAVLAANAQTVFIFPVRNPMDCARSNLGSGHWRHLVTREDAAFGPVLTRILGALRWFRVRERAAPERFWSFTEDELGDAFLSRFADFGRLTDPPSWREDAPHAIEIAGRAPHAEASRALYARLVAELFGDDPNMRARLERFL